MGSVISNFDFLHAATHHSVKCDGKKVKAIPAKIRIYHRHHEAPKALRAEIAAHAHLGDDPHAKK